MTVDHVIARALGGTSRWSNLVAACADCNGRKRDRTPEQAGMLLRHKPYEPRYIPFVVVRRNTERDEWGNYVGLYDISIEQRVTPA
ncbi:MAG TPA: HNH endonuclease [Candidatus Acidoferrales bacterium]|nr:HNH endonuclease [Candidatus Acidoferrales bacterium]